MSKIGGAFKTLSAKMAGQLDQELMSTGAFSIDQLMELAGLSVAQVVSKQYPRKEGKDRVLMLVGPGNNGGDGLVASRHLKLWGYDPVLYYPKKSTKNELYKRLLTQLHDLDIAEVESFDEIKDLVLGANPVLVIVDALFGFSFKPPIRAPFDEVVNYLSQNHGKIAPIVSVDIPSGWDVDEGPVSTDIRATVLVSLTAPKPCASHFVDEGGIHYLGGRFINPKIAKKYGIEDIVDKYQGSDLIVKL